MLTLNFLVLILQVDHARLDTSAWCLKEVLAHMQLVPNFHVLGYMDALYTNEFFLLV